MPCWRVSTTGCGVGRGGGRDEGRGASPILAMSCDGSEPRRGPSHGRRRGLATPGSPAGRSVRPAGWTPRAHGASRAASARCATIHRTGGFARGRRFAHGDVPGDQHRRRRRSGRDPRHRVAATPREPGLADVLAKTHLFAGTSTGGLIALGLASDLPLQTLRDVYEHRTKEIFRESIFDDIRDLGKLIGADYQLDNLSRVLHDVFGDRALHELSTRVLVTAFDLDNQDPDPAARTWKPKIFHNFPGVDDDGDQLAYRVGTYTSAAPTIFPTADGFIDGGVFATNPAMCALAQTQDPRNDPAERGRLDELVVLSLGTGRSLQYVEGPTHNWGYVQWIRPLINLMLDGVNGIADYQCRQVLGDRYYRFAPTFPPDKTIAQDSVAEIPYLVEFAEHLDLSDVAAWLTSIW